MGRKALASSEGAKRGRREAKAFFLFL